MMKLIRLILGKLGYSLIKDKYKSGIDPKLEGNMLGGLLRSRDIGISPTTIIDAGAAQGTWTEKCKTVWPDSSYILVEPLIEREPDLEQLKKNSKNVDVVYAALGETEGTVTFSVYDDFDGSGIGINESGHVAGKRDVRILPIDSIVKDHNSTGPFLIKLDTHGFEVPILEGAANTLEQTVLIVVEVYGFKIAKEARFFWQMCEYLDKKGFRLYDMVDILRREADAAFWQCDMFFIRAENPAFANNNYK